MVDLRIAGNPVEPDRLYTLATNDFLARGGDGYAVFKDAKELVGANDAKLIANHVMIHIRKEGTVTPGIEDRIIIARDNPPGD